MYSLDLEVLRLDFVAAMIKVPLDGYYDWMNEEWVDTPQELEITHSKAGVTVFSSVGRFAQKGPHLIEILSPQVHTEEGVVAYLRAKPGNTGLSEDALQKAVKVDTYLWGRLFSLDWISLGYAPGGTEYCLLPTGGPAITIGFLSLDWTSIQVHPKA